MAFLAKMKDWIVEHKGKVLMLGSTVAVVGLASPAAAVTIDLNATLGPLLDSITALIPSLINLLIAIVPLAMIGIGLALIFAIIWALIGFIEDILSGVKLSGKRGKR